MRVSAAVIGGGPAGLMAAEVLAERGVDTHIYEAMPIVGRKFLVAGHGGLNLTHTEPVEAFVAKFGNRAGVMGRFLERFSPENLRAWASGLGVETFVGTSGRVFPRELKASPLLRAWIRRLAEQGVQFHTRERWHGFTQDGGLVFESGEIHPGVAVFALGGASYPKLGSDGGWVAKFEARGVPVQPLLASNCGFEVEWSEAFRDRAAGKPLKNLRLSCGGRTVDGELLLTGYGVEGGGVYALGPEIRAAIKQRGHAVLHLDLKRDLSLEKVRARLARPRGKASLATFLRKTLRLASPVPALLRKVGSTDDLAEVIKRLPVTLTRARPLAEAISTAGGVAFEALDEHLMLKALPGVFVAGEMLDFDAPTGGYLLQAAFMTGAAAGAGAAAWLERGDRMTDR